ncbi:hypothetical protein IBX28_13090 [Streptomyces sp. SHP 1-2]|nr:hypothetical protein [Streptomyces sp. SHP 1-2]MCW5251440.1 hypothetical protein [Streptomyces sp. SHP 1-2]
MGRVARGRARARLCGALALLVAVVSVLCVLGRADRSEPSAPLSAKDRVHSAAVFEPSDAGSTPCGGKAVADHGAQRAEGSSPPVALPGPALPDDGCAPGPPRRPGVLPGGPAPPPPTTLHSVLRI